MIKLLRRHAPPSQEYLSIEELGKILQRVDENLVVSPLAQEAREDIASSAILPISDLLGRLHELKQMRAPLFVVKGRDIRNQLKRLANLPIKVLSYKQIRFNRDLLELLTLLLNVLQRSYQHTTSSAQLEQALVAQQQQLQASQQTILSLTEQIHHQILRIDQQEQELLLLRETVALLRSQHPNAQHQEPRP